MPTVVVHHAGSFGAVIRDLAPAFEQASGWQVEPHGGPALALGYSILDGESRPDVFISADAEVNRVLMGPRGRDLVRWYVHLAGQAMVLLYSPASRFLAALDAAAAGTRAWHTVVREPGFRLLRGDAERDPGGYRAVFIAQLAERHHDLPGFAAEMLAQSATRDPFGGDIEAFRAGSADGLLAYRTSALLQALPHAALPPEVDLSAERLADWYAQAEYRTPRNEIIRGTPIRYSATIPTNAARPEGAQLFVRFLISEAGRAAMAARGFEPLPPLLVGATDAVAAALRNR
jgi:molybdate/tungstate transport system substrate-binding protein